MLHGDPSSSMNMGNIHQNALHSKTYSLVDGFQVLKVNGCIEWSQNRLILVI